MVDTPTATLFLNKVFHSVTDLELRQVTARLDMEGVATLRVHVELDKIGLPRDAAGSSWPYVAQQFIASTTGFQQLKTRIEAMDPQYTVNTPCQAEDRKSILITLGYKAPAR